MWLSVDTVFTQQNDLIRSLFDFTADGETRTVSRLSTHHFAHTLQCVGFCVHLFFRALSVVMQQLNKFNEYEEKRVHNIVT